MNLVEFIDKFMKADEDTKKKVEEILSASAESENPLMNPCKNPIHQKLTSRSQHHLINNQSYVES